LDRNALYSGGELLNNRIARFVTKTPADSEKTYHRKRSCAADQHVNYLANAVNYFVSYLFSHPMNFVPREAKVADEIYNDFKNDCDGSGRDFEKLMELAFQESLLNKVSALVVSFPELDKLPESLKEWEDSGAGRPVLQLFKSAEIVDWEYDETGEIEWITLSKRAVRRVSPFSNKTKNVEKISVYTKTTLTAFHFESENELLHDSEPNLIETIEHGFFTVPVVMLDLGDRFIGDLLFAPQVANLIARFKRAWLTQTHSHSMPVFMTNVDLSEAFKSAEVGIQLDSQSSIDFMKPPSESFTALQHELNDTALELFRSVNLQFLGENSSKQPWRSGSSKMVDQDAGTLTVRQYGKWIRETAQRLFNLIAAYRQDDYRFDVRGFEHLQTDDLSELVEIRSKLGIKSPTLIAEFDKKIVSQLLKDMTEETKAKVFKEIEEASIEKTALDPVNPDLASDDKSNVIDLLEE